MNVKDPTQTPLIPRPIVGAQAQTPTPQAEAKPQAKADQFAQSGRTTEGKPLNDLVPQGESRGQVLTPALKQKLAPYLKARPKKGFGYIVAEGDVLDQLLQEAYDDSEGDENESDEDRLEKWIGAFLSYNCHLGMNTADALSTAIGQLLFFPQLNEMLEFHTTLREAANPLSFPAIESFLKLAELPPEAASQFHFVGGKTASNAALKLRADESRERRGLGKRTKGLRGTETVQGSLSRLARQAGSVVLQMIEWGRALEARTPPAMSKSDTSEAVQALMLQAEAAPSWEAAQPFASEAITAQLLEAMKAWKVQKADQAHDALKRSGLDGLLVESLLRGKLTYQASDRHLNRLRDSIRSRAVSVNDIKNGILAFDAAAQRLAIVSGKNGPFQYATRVNHARDSLITFARSLHR